MSNSTTAIPFDLNSVSSVGVRFDRVHAEARGCWLSFYDSPLRYAPEILATYAEPLPSHLLRQFLAIERGESDAELREAVSTEVTSIAIRICEQLMADVGDTSDKILAMGVHGSGTWHGQDAGSRSYRELVQSSRLAERFGVTVLDDFPSRDLAQGGSGGPVEGHGNWILLADRSTAPGHRWRALVDVSSHVTHFNLIPSLKQNVADHVFHSQDICAGNRLFSELVSMASSQQQSGSRSGDSTAIGQATDFDERASKGRLIVELAEIWEATCQRGHGWDPDGVSALPFVYALKNSVYATSSLDDQLATATYFLANEIQRYVKYCVPASQPVGELFLMGEGSKNSLLLRQLKEQLPAVTIRFLSELGQDRTIYAASIAALTLLHIWQIPVPPTNPSAVPRVLGRLTPGSPSNWRRVLNEMTTSAPWLLPLREAI